MARSPFYFSALLSIVAVLNAAPTPHIPTDFTSETVSVILETFGNHKEVQNRSDVVVNSGCIEIQETVLPTKIQLNTVDPEYYKIVTYESTDCNDEIKKVEGSTDVIFLNDRHPICSFMLNLGEIDPSTIGNVLVTFHLKQKLYNISLSDSAALSSHDICDSHSGQHKFAERVTVYSENPDVNTVMLFRQIPSSNDTGSKPIIAGNGTHLASETLKSEKLVRSIKIIENNNGESI